MIQGQSCGLVKNFALLCYISMGDSSYHFMDVLFDCGMKSLKKGISQEEITTWYSIHVNGAWIGIVKDGTSLVKKMRELRRRIEINWETGIAIDYGSRLIRINTDSGRAMRPLLIVENGNILITRERILQLSGELNPKYDDSWTRLLAEGLIEFLDVEEEENAMIAMYAKEVNDSSTHCEIHPATMYGVAASLIPFPDHSPSARNTFQWYVS